MDWLNLIDLGKFLLFTLVLTRVSGLAVTAPVLGASETPMRVRALTAFALALLLMPSQWNVTVEYPTGVLGYLAIVAGDLIIGLFLGWGIKLLFYGMEMGGELIASASGLMIADIYDPSAETNVPLFSKFFQLLALAVFLAIGGHRLLISGLLDTFQIMPPGQGVFSQPMVDAFITLLAQSFSLGIRTAAPAMLALLTASVVMGLIGRTVPQLNVLVMGFGLNAILTFGMLFLTVGGIAWTFQDQIEPVFQSALEALHNSTPGSWFS